MINRKGFTLVEIMIVVFIIALLAAIAIPNLLRSRISANEASAKAILKTIATSLENYSVINTVYPAATTDLTTASPPYLNKDYFVGVHNGYIFTSVLTDYTYTITATPSASSQGNITFTVSTGVVMEEGP